MEGREEGIMDGRAQNSGAAGPFYDATLRARPISATAEVVADGGVARLAGTRRTLSTA